MSYVITPVPSEYLPTAWPDIAKLLEPAAATAVGKLDVGDVYLGIVDGGYVPWLVLHNNEPVAAFTTRVVQYPKRRALAVDWVGGRHMNRWIEAGMSVIKEQARLNDCQHVEGYGRLAWGRVLKRYKFEPEYVAYRMELEDGQG